MTTQSASTSAGIASAATLASVSRTSAARLCVGIAIVSLTVKWSCARDAARIIIIAELRLAPDIRWRGAVRRRRGDTPRQWLGAAAAAAGAAAAEPAAAGEAPGDGDGAAGFGSGALDCVNTIDVTVRSGVAFCWTSGAAVSRKPKAARLARHERQHRTPEVGELERRRDRRVHLGENLLLVFPFALVIGDRELNFVDRLVAAVRHLAENSRHSRRRHLHVHIAQHDFRNVRLRVGLLLLRVLNIRQLASVLVLEARVAGRLLLVQLVENFLIRGNRLVVVVLVVEVDGVLVLLDEYFP